MIKIKSIILFLLTTFSLNSLAQTDSMLCKKVTEINSELNDFFPLFVDSNLMYFSSDKKILTEEKVTDFSQNIFSSKVEKGTNSAPEKLSYLLNSDNHDACAGISTDRKTFYIYKRFNGGNIYFCNKNKKGNWKSLRTFALNTEFHEPSIANHDSVFFLVSDKPKGKGKHDIYTSTKSKLGFYSKLENVEELNSEADENYVFLTNNGNTIYFSSNRSDSTFNIYKSTKNELGKWNTPEKLPFPINSPKNDITYSEDLSGNAYFASDRDDAGKTKYDIFKIEIIKPVEKTITATVPLKLDGISMIEDSMLGQIFLIKDSITIQCFKKDVPEFISVDKALVIDTNKILTVSDIVVDSKLKVLTDPFEEIIKIEKTKPKKIEKTENIAKSDLDAMIPFEISYCQIQVGAYFNITTVKQFLTKYPKLTGKVDMDDKTEYRKFVMKETCKDLETATKLQKQCMTEYESADDTFIAVYGKEGQRVVIYFDVASNKYILLK